MAKQRTRVSTPPQTAVHCERGQTDLTLNGRAITYRYRAWALKVNPRLLFPAFRKEHRKFIVVDGKRKGYCEMRGGLIPMQRYDLPGAGFVRAFKTVLRHGLGICCSKRERGYTFVKFGRFKYVVLKKLTAEGLLWCEVYEIGTERSIGSFIFNRDLTEVYFRYVMDGAQLTLQVIIGYVVDTLVYSMAASSLVKTVKVIV